MIMSRKLARRRMLMWSKQNTPGTGEVVRHYVFKEGNSALEDGYTGTLTRAKFEGGKIVLTPTFHSNDARDWFNNASVNITADTADFAQYDNLCIECYYDGLITFTTKDKITIGTSSNSKEIANAKKQIYTFNLAEVTIDDKITLSYERDVDNSEKTISSSFYITNIWFESKEEPGTQEPENPTEPAQYNVTVNTGNFTFNGEDVAIENTDYTATVTAADGYEISSVTATINGNTVGSYMDGTLTIPAEKVNGNINIEIVVQEIIVEPEEPEIPNRLDVYVKGDTELRNGYIDDTYYYPSGYSSAKSRGYKFKTPTTGDQLTYIEIRGDDVTSDNTGYAYFIIKGVDFTPYDKLYIDYNAYPVAQIGDHLLAGYGGDGIKKKDYEAYTNSCTSQEFLISDVAGEKYIKLSIDGMTIQNGINGAIRIDIYNIWLEKSSTESGGTDGGDSGATEPTTYSFSVTDATGETYSYNFDEGMSWETFVASDYNDGNFSFSKSFTVPYDTGNYVLSSIMSYRDKPVLVKDFDSGNPNVTIYAVEKSKVDSGELTSDFADENIYIESNRTYSILDIATVIESNTPTESSERFDLFDSSRSDNFIFGKYAYSPSAGGSVPSEGQITWPPTGDEENTSVNQIILNQKPTGLLAPPTSKNAYLYLRPNNVSEIWDNNGEEEHYYENEIFVNNVYYNGHAAGTYGIGANKEGTTSKIYFKAYRTNTSGVPTIKYVNSTGEIVYATINVNGTTATEYCMDTAIVAGGYFKLEAASGCGSLIVTDIRIEQIK